MPNSLLAWQVWEYIKALPAYNEIDINTYSGHVWDQGVFMSHYKNTLHACFAGWTVLIFDGIYSRFTPEMGLRVDVVVGVEARAKELLDINFTEMTRLFYGNSTTDRAKFEDLVVSVFGPRPEELNNIDVVTS